MTCHYPLQNKNLSMWYVNKYTLPLKRGKGKISYKLELSQKCHIPPHSALSHNKCHVIETRAVGMRAIPPPPPNPISRNCDLKPIAGIR